MMPEQKRNYIMWFADALLGYTLTFLSIFPGLTLQFVVLLVSGIVLSSWPAMSLILRNFKAFVVSCLASQILSI